MPVRHAAPLCESRGDRKTLSRAHRLEDGQRCGTSAISQGVDKNELSGEFRAGLADLFGLYGLYG